MKAFESKLAEPRGLRLRDILEMSGIPLDKAFKKDMEKVYEESIFKTRQFSTIQRYLRNIHRPDPIPSEICLENSTTSTDEEKSVLFNTFFCSVFSKSNDHEDECTAESSEIPAILEDQSIEPNFSNDNITNLLQNLNPQKAGQSAEHYAQQMF